MRSTLITALFAALSVSACQQQAAPDPAQAQHASEGFQAAAAAPAAPTVVTPAPAPDKALEKKTFGAGVTTLPAVALASLVKEPGKYSGQTVRTEGKVSSVCKAMGCWLRLEDESGQAHITMANHAFAIPSYVQGKRATVEGKVLPPAKEQDHCDEEAKSQTGKVAKIELEATGVQILD